MSEVPLYPTCTLLATTMDKVHLVRLFRVGKLAVQGLLDYKGTPF
jgi:hypothetical protein